MNDDTLPLLIARNKSLNMGQRCIGACTCWYVGYQRGAACSVGSLWMLPGQYIMARYERTVTGAKAHEINTS